MDERKLDWNKVFKEILDKRELPRNNASEQCGKDSNDLNVIKESQSTAKEYHSKIKESDECSSSSSLNLKIYDNQLCKGNNNPFNNHLTKVSSVSEYRSTSYREQTKKLSNFKVNNEIPEWNTVFKSILDNNTTRKREEQKDLEYTLKKPDTYPRKSERVKNKKFYKKKLPDATFKMDEEEKKVREMFAQSRMFKFECPFKNHNDLAGSGVDIFKCDRKSMLPPWERNTECDSELEDESSEQYSESSVPLKGVIANMKPFTRDDAPCIPFTEAWDDDLLF